MTQTEAAEHTATQLTHTWRRLAIPVLAISMAAGFVVLATLRWDFWVARMSLQTTNDAYVRAEMTRLSSRVAGAVKTVEVVDFQRVKAGDVLVRIDPADYEAQVAQAEASVVSAKAALDNLANQVELQYATIAQAEAQRVSLQALELEAAQEQERQQTLSQTSSGTRQKLEQSVAASTKAQADVRASTAVVAAQRHQLEVLAGTKQQRSGDLLGAQASLQAARLRLGYTTITAPFDGVVSERQVQAGDYVNVGSSLINVVPLPRVYIMANYKETQLGRVQVGQKVDIVVDTFSGQPLTGRVERVSPASGSQFALLPPDNATGNFTKVVQRVPVRIEFDARQPLLARLLPGMSATTRIHVEDTEDANGR
ncbi:membrane fusion protein (multidrug efflux system) [Tardiphaga robiniae]|uniref:HlyD family secretion protein n=1 Tax=Tardiphaga robiniae TaxID=943830 RepID=UPI002862E04C|nr:HlyD family secretion protein [Tardiphaga robiniae]MDR6660844.1 membrane fusion protein (multidrug efflux system) [Tardiphaga robiniae]